MGPARRDAGLHGGEEGQADRERDLRALLPLILDAGNALFAQTDATGAILGFVSLEDRGTGPRLIRRNANLGNRVVLSVLGQTTGANIERSGLTRLFVTVTPIDDGLQLFRVESDGTLSPVGEVAERGPGRLGHLRGVQRGSSTITTNPASMSSRTLL